MRTKSISGHFCPFFLIASAVGSADLRDIPKGIDDCVVEVGHRNCDVTYVGRFKCGVAVCVDDIGAFHLFLRPQNAVASLFCIYRRTRMQILAKIIEK